MKKDIIYDSVQRRDTDYGSRFDDSVWGRDGEEWVGHIILI